MPRGAVSRVLHGGRAQRPFLVLPVELGISASTGTARNPRFGEPLGSLPSASRNSGCRAVIIKIWGNPPKRRGHRSRLEEASGYPRGRSPKAATPPLTHTKTKTKNKKNDEHPVSRGKSARVANPGTVAQQSPSNGGQNRQGGQSWNRGRNVHLRVDKAPYTTNAPLWEGKTQQKNTKRPLFGRARPNSP
jgi:hypothetical protein